MNLLSAGTIEEHVWSIQEQRETLAEDVFGAHPDLERIPLTRSELIDLRTRE